MGFPSARHVPLAIVTTAGGKVSAIEDRRIIDANRARVYANPADPANVFRITSGWVAAPALAGGDGTDGSVWFDAPTCPFIAAFGGTVPGYPATAAVVGTEARLPIYSEEWNDTPATIGASQELTAFLFWDDYRTAAGESVLNIQYARGWPGEVGSDGNLVSPEPFTRAATADFTSVIRLRDDADPNSGIDPTAGTIDSVTDERPSFGV